MTSRGYLCTAFKAKALKSVVPDHAAYRISPKVRMILKMVSETILRIILTFGKQESSKGRLTCSDRLRRKMTATARCCVLYKRANISIIERYEPKQTFLYE